MKKSGKRGVGRRFASDASPSSPQKYHPALVSSRIIKRAVEELCARLGLSEEQVVRLLEERGEAIHIPVSIFSNTKLSGLELVCKYLKEELSIHFSEISKLLNRDYRTVWTTYSIASKKHKGALSVPRSKYFFPTLILTDRRLSVLEAIVSYLKDELGLRFTEIGSELHRDQRNIWTVYRRAKRKLAASAGEKSGKSGPEGEDENTK
ncbi:hypothetical protein HYU16_01875 [Candidatus Woesearchaeota archaeon]|nr:hypothetical protein [Candidatus Woesearchaeota archaeon]MBI2550176.1 hypothetical protein [Candidatus Woesearchaeota archaeon]